MRVVEPTSASIDYTRGEMLARRRSLAAGVVARSSAVVVERLRGLQEVREARTIGAYLGIRGEVDPSALRDDEGLDVALPVTTPGEPLRFVVPVGPLLNGPFGTRQPGDGREVLPDDLDLVLVPVVVADQLGNRVGHGAGFYDRTFAHIREAGQPRPLLIGLCHAFQVVPQLEARPWDVPLDLVVTEVGLIRPRR
jgi:5-formyltetrahydrofolate cyclo-ligase